MENMKKKIFSFIGLPASGKGTQAKVFAEKHGFDSIGMGDLIRSAIKENENSNDPFMRELMERYNAGTPQPDEVAFDLLIKKLDTINKDGVVFDNFPFNVNQSRLLSDFAKKNNWERPVLFHIKVDPETTIERIAYRKICPDCNRIYNQKNITVCEDCGVALESRSDDTEDTARKRIKHYVKSINELLSFYLGSNSIIEIDGEPPISEVTKEIEEKYGKYFK